jgi:hypothetical protein
LADHRADAPVDQGTGPLREQIRLAEGRDPESSADVIDSQSIKGADTVGRATRGYDAGKNVNGRKRFIVTSIANGGLLSAPWPD